MACGNDPVACLCGQIVAKWEKSEREPLELVVVSRERAKRVLEEEKNQEIARFKYAKEKWDDDHDHGGIAYATDKFDEGPFWRKIAYLENELATWYVRATCAVCFVVLTRLVITTTALRNWKAANSSCTFQR